VYNKIAYGIGTQRYEDRISTENILLYNRTEVIEDFYVGDHLMQGK
jgi:hypothetical protein